MVAVKFTFNPSLPISYPLLPISRLLSNSPFIDDMSLDQREPHLCVHLVAGKRRIFTLTLQLARLDIPARVRIEHAKIRADARGNGARMDVQYASRFTRDFGQRGCQRDF